MITPDLMHIVDHGVLLDVTERILSTLTPKEYHVFAERMKKHWV